MLLLKKAKGQAVKFLDVCGRAWYDFNKDASSNVHNGFVLLDFSEHLGTFRVSFESLFYRWGK